jgi:hypothetical protein
VILQRERFGRPGDFGDGQPRRYLEPGARGEQQPDALRVHPAPDERQHTEGLLVEPLRVVHERRHRPPLRRLRERGERGEPDEEAIGGRSVGQPAGHPQRLAPDRGQRPGLLEPLQERYEQPVQCRERETGLRLHTRCPQHPQPGGLGRAWSSSTVFPMPASPRSSTTRLSPARRSATR